jgi:hypothetical protein
MEIGVNYSFGFKKKLGGKQSSWERKVPVLFKIMFFP